MLCASSCGDVAARARRVASLDCARTLCARRFTMSPSVFATEFLDMPLSTRVYIVNVAYMHRVHPDSFIVGARDWVPEGERCAPADGLLWASRHVNRVDDFVKTRPLTMKASLIPPTCLSMISSPLVLRRLDVSESSGRSSRSHSHSHTWLSTLFVAPLARLATLHFRSFTFT